jgi:hypothetical protein
LYGAIMSYEGRPAAYQLARIDALAAELDDVQREFDALLAKSLPPVNKALKSARRPPIQVSSIYVAPEPPLSSGEVHQALQRALAR